MGWLLGFAVWYAVMTALFATVQAVENIRAKPGDQYWAPVWWIALTWPWQIAVVVARPFRRAR